MITMQRKQKVKGPGGLVLELDADQIVPDDPGQGTPALLVLGRETGTYNCAMDTGMLDDTRLTDAQLAWLQEIEYSIDCWYTAHTRGAQEVGNRLNFTAEQLADWRAYERVRKGGRWNMFDPAAREATGLPQERYSFVMDNFSMLRALAEAEGGAS